MVFSVQHSALTKKGLRQFFPLKTHNTIISSALCPDEEGIKTEPGASQDPGRFCSALCPDEEGIKTMSKACSPLAPGFSTLP